MVKLEGGRGRVDTVRFLTEQSIPVCSHLGLLPQSIHQLGGYLVQGREDRTAQALYAVNYYNNSNLYFNRNNRFKSHSATTASDRLLIYAEQQIQFNSNSKQIETSYFLVKLSNENNLVVYDYWSSDDIVLELPSDYATSWFRFVYTRRLNSVDINLYKFETSPDQLGVAQIRLVPVTSKQMLHSNFLFEDHLTREQTQQHQAAYSNLFVGGVNDYVIEQNFSHDPLRKLAKFHGYIMNLQYTSLSSQCSAETCSSSSIAQRQYAIFSSSTSKQYKLERFVDRDSLMIDDVCTALGWPVSAHAQRSDGRPRPKPNQPKIISIYGG
jgi:hypothetical protein